MDKLRRLFGDINMTWPRIIILALITGTYTGLINQVPFFYDTSFRDIAISFECWILFAIFIIVNCEKWWEAVMKCFIFFLVSQPLIYLVEAPFQGLEIFRYYPHWFRWTLLTIPGSFVAFWVKKKNILSAIILSVATSSLVALGIRYLNETIYNFPHHILSVVFCIILAIVLILILLPKKRERTIAFAITFIALIAAIFKQFINTNESLLSTSLDKSHVWSISKIEDSSLVRAEITDGCNIELYSNKNGKTKIYFTNENGDTEEYEIVIGGPSHSIHMYKVG